VCPGHTTGNVIRLKYDDARANNHAARLKEMHGLPNNPLFDDIWKQETDAQVAENLFLFEHLPTPLTFPETGDEEVGDITLEELKTNIQSSKSSSAPGADGVTYQMLNNVPVSILCHLVDVFTQRV
jgi:hypothetical protein